MHKTSSAKSWRKYSSRYKIQGSKCQDCSKVYYPPKSKCIKCGSNHLHSHIIQGKGKLVSWSKVYAAPSGFDKENDYIVGIVEIEGGERMTTQIVSCHEEDLKIGMQLVSTFRRIYTDDDDGIIHYGIKFKPA